MPSVTPSAPNPASNDDADAKVDIPALRAVGRDEFDRLWSVYAYLQQGELHVNEVQSHYRTLASTWLLATFGAAGFLLTNASLAIPIESSLVASVVCLLGAIGIILLWNLDLRVSQPLLRARFFVGLDMEVDVPWLPPVRRKIHSTFKSGTTPRVATFYVAATAVPLLFGAALFGFWASENQPDLLVPGLLLWLVAVIAIPGSVAIGSGIGARRRKEEAATQSPHTDGDSLGPYG